MSQALSHYVQETHDDDDDDDEEPELRATPQTKLSNEDITGESKDFPTTNTQNKSTTPPTKVEERDNTQESVKEVPRQRG